MPLRLTMTTIRRAESRRRRADGRRLRAELASYRTDGERSQLAALLTRHDPTDLEALADLTGRPSLAA